MKQNPWNQINPHETLTLESAQLKRCQSDEGFFKRLATVTIPRMQKLKIFNDRISEWEQDLTESSLVKNGLENLICFLEWHWDFSKKTHNRQLRNLVWSAVRKIRGPICYINWATTLPNYINSTINEILTIDIENHQRPSLEPFQQLLKSSDLKEYITNQDCDPRFLWQTLRLLPLCWERRYEKAATIQWKKPKGTWVQVLYQAYNQTHNFLLGCFSEELRSLDKKKPSPFFKREKFQNIYDRFVSEIQLREIDMKSELHIDSIAHELPVIKAKNDPRQQDAAIAKRFMLNLWGKNPNISQSSMGSKAYEPIQIKFSAKYRSSQG